MKNKRLISLILATIMIFSLTSCNKDMGDSEVKDADVVDNVVQGPTEETPEPIIENSEPPILENDENKPVEEFVYKAEDNPPDPIPKIDAAMQLINILQESLTKSLSQNKYSIKVSEVIDSNSLYGNIDFDYRAIDMTKTGEDIYFEAVNGSRFYKGKFNQLPGGSVSNVSAKNLITSRNIEALKELGIENGINEIYNLFANTISIGDNYDIYLNNPDSITISYKDLEDGSTEYTMEIINSANYSGKSSSNRASSNYVDKSTRQLLENSQSKLVLTLDNSNLVKSVYITDTMSCGFYNQTAITRYMSFSYGVDEETLSEDVQSGEGELSITSGSTNKETNAGRIIKYTNPSSADTSGGIDDSKWTMEYKKTQEGSKAVQYHGSPLSNYNVNGIKTGQTIKEIKELMDVVISQDNKTLIGLIKRNENIFTVVCYLNDDMTVSSIDAKLNPISDTLERAMTTKEVGSYAAAITAQDIISLFNSQKNTLMNQMYKMLTKSFIIQQTVSFDGQNINQYSQESYGSEIHPELNYVYQSMYKSSREQEGYDIDRIGIFNSPSTVLNTFIQNAPNIDLDQLGKVEGDDGIVTYGGEISPVSYENLIKLACDYQGVKTPNLEDFKNVPAPTKTTVNMQTTNGLITSLQIKSESKRDSVTFNANIEYK